MITLKSQCFITFFSFVVDSLLFFTVIFAKSCYSHVVTLLFSYSNRFADTYFDLMTCLKKLIHVIKHAKNITQIH